MTRIEATERTIGQIFSDDFAFEIPPYQRPYAWEEDQARELLEDILGTMDDDDMYFLGSIVLIKRPDQPKAVVIDGQQRLTTLTILLSVLRDLTTSAEKRLDRRAYVFQKPNADRGTDDRFRLLLRQRDRAFFLKYVQELAATCNLPETDTIEGSQLRIVRNTALLRTAVEQIAEDRRDAIVAFIVQRCYLVVISVPTADAARKIFTVL